MTKSPVEHTPPWKAAFEARTDLAEYGDNALGLFALAVRFNIEDLDTVAAEAITDGSDDKKCDIVYIDLDRGVAVVAQCYKASVQKASAPANKASDLNTAVGWLLQRDINELPDTIRPSAVALRAGINEGKITHLHVWYIHNLPESAAVASELKTVEASTSTALRAAHKDANVKTAVLEVGQKRLDEWYNDTQSPILVGDHFTIDVDAGFEIAAPNWKAYVTSIPLQFLRREYQKHKTKLFSANVRDYLESKSSDSNINNGIKKTAEFKPDNFWAYNNGLSILVNSYDPPKALKSGRTRLTIHGMSIVNGAQTTGAIASLDAAPPKEAQVAVRFIQTDDAEIVYDVIRFNNSQNKITASDFRSTDSVQKRLKDDMAKIPQAEYEGGRRGGTTDAIRRRPNLLASYTVGQSLAAVHGDATIAYNQKADIWTNDTLYSRYFNEQTTASHIVFAYALLRAVEAKKIDLVNKSKNKPDTMTASEEKQLAFLRKRGAIFLTVAALSACIEVFCGKRVANLFRLSFGTKVSPSRAQATWAEIVDTTIPLSIHLDEAFTHGLQNQERVRAAIDKFKSLVETTAAANAAQYKKFSGALTTK